MNFSSLLLLLVTWCWLWRLLSFFVELAELAKARSCFCVPNIVWSAMLTILVSCAKPDFARAAIGTSLEVFSLFVFKSYSFLASSWNQGSEFCHRFLPILPSSLRLLIQVRLLITCDWWWRENMTCGMHSLFEVLRHVITVELELTDEMDLFLHKLCFY